jgi:hypothetical protein
MKAKRRPLILGADNELEDQPKGALGVRFNFGKAAYVDIFVSENSGQLLVEPRGGEVSIGHDGSNFVIQLNKEG